MSSPLVIYADATRFAAWLATAPAGASFDYAIAGSLNPEEPVVAAVAKAIEAGDVAPVQRGKPGERRYQVQRCAPTSSAAGAGRGARTTLPRISPVFAATPEGRLFALLCEIAEAGLECPSDAELARRLQWDDREQARYRRERLVASGHIAVRALGGRFDGRVVTITETGARTAEPGTRSGAMAARERGKVRHG